MVLCAQGGLGSVLGPRLEEDRGLAALSTEGDRGGLGRSLRDGRLRAFGGLCPGHLSSGGEGGERVGFSSLPWSHASVWFKITFLFSEVKLREDSFPFQ